MTFVFSMAEDSGFDLEKEYSVLQKKYSLPGFEELNEDFGVGRMDTERIDLLLKEVKRFLSDKLRSYEGFLEAVLNPSNANLFIFTFVKALSKEDKDKITEIYKRLAGFDLELMSMDLQYSEEREAKFIREFFDFWQETKKELFKISDNVKESWSKEGKTQTKGYFG